MMQKLQRLCNAILNAGRVSACRIFAVFLAFNFLLPALSGQVSGVKYLMKYDTLTQGYGCHIVITAGNSVSPPQRAQFNAQYSFVVDTMVDLTVVKNYNPIINNSFYTGVDPVKWALSNPFLYDGKKYISANPQLLNGAWYDDVHEGDTILLFSIKATPNLCGDGIRLYDNETDHPQTFNFKQTFAIGGNTQDYQGNLIDSFTSTLVTYIIQDEEIMCLENEYVIDPVLPLGFTLSSSDSSVINISGDTLIVLNPGNVKFILTEISTGCLVLERPVLVPALPVIEVFDTVLTVTDTITFKADGPGIWISSNPNVASISPEGLVVALSAGTSRIDFIGITGCSAIGIELVVQPLSSTFGVENEELPFAYPNPSNGWVQIKANAEWTISSVIDETGKSINDCIAEDGRKINLSACPAGMFFIKLVHQKGQMIQIPVIRK